MSTNVDVVVVVVVLAGIFKALFVIPDLTVNVCTPIVPPETVHVADVIVLPPGAVAIIVAWSPIRSMKLVEVVGVAVAVVP